MSKRRYLSYKRPIQQQVLLRSGNRIQGPETIVLANYSVLENIKRKTGWNYNIAHGFREYITNFYNTCAKNPHSNYKWNCHSFKIWFCNWYLRSYSCHFWWQSKGVANFLWIKLFTDAFTCCCIFVSVKEENLEVCNTISVLDIYVLPVVTACRSSMLNDFLIKSCFKVVVCGNELQKQSIIINTNIVNLPIANNFSIFHQY